MGIGEPKTEETNIQGAKRKRSSRREGQLMHTFCHPAAYAAVAY